MNRLEAKWAFKPLCACCSSVCCHTVYDVKIPRLMPHFSPPPSPRPHLLPHPVMLLVLTALLPRLFFHLSTTKCLPYMKHCRSTPLAPSLPSSLLFLCRLTELHSGYVRPQVKVSLPLSRETENRGALEEMCMGREKGKNSRYKRL